MDNIICTCGHSVDYHRVNGCNHTHADDPKRWCGCSKTPETVHSNALIAEMTATIARLTAEVEEAREALKPFVFPGPFPDKNVLVTDLVFWSDDLRRAAAYLAAHPEQK